MEVLLRGGGYTTHTWPGIGATAEPVEVVLAAKDGGLPRLEITASSAQITREDFVKALGEQAKMYDVRSLKLVKAK
jgi:hypothetical protein